MKILIAEDDAANRRLLEVTLTRWNYEVALARDGDEAWGLLEADPDLTLAILDWMMPGLDGPDVCRRVRAQQEQRREANGDSAPAPYRYLLLLTSKDQRGDVVTGLEAGADDYLIKPFDPHELQGRLRAGRRVLDLQDALLRSLTERERAEEQLRSQHETLKQAQSQMVQTEKLAGLGQMVAGVAHEINNPLAFVTNNLAVLERDLQALGDLLTLYAEGEPALATARPDLHARIRDLSERIDLAYTLPNLQGLLDRSREGLRRLEQIVRDLRDFARLDESERQAVELNAGIVSTLNIIAGRAKHKQVRLESRLAPGLPLVTCYPAKINQVVMNLVANAIDACAAGDTVTVVTRALPADEGVEIEVADTGEGMTNEVRERIFDPFFTTKPVGEGTGLGLSISYGIVRDHGGAIEVTSEPGQGTRFVVRLPLGGTPPT